MNQRVVLDKALDLEPVGSHGVHWHPASWRRALERSGLSGMLIEQLNSVPDSDSESKVRITRSQVVECFGRSPVTGYLAAIIWGCGTGARNRGRMLKVFFDHQNHDVVARIDALVRVLGDADPSTAWSAITRTHRLKWLGVAFGSKIAYFAALAARGPLDGSLPLIADARVQAALNTGVTVHREAYVEYCALAQSLCQQLTGERQRPDQIEYALFSLAGSAQPEEVA